MVKCISSEREHLSAIYVKRKGKRFRDTLSSLRLRGHNMLLYRPINFFEMELYSDSDLISDDNTYKCNRDLMSDIMDEIMMYGENVEKNAKLLNIHFTK